MPDVSEIQAKINQAWEACDYDLAFDLEMELDELLDDGDGRHDAEADTERLR